MQISLVIPVFNEEATIARALDRVLVQRDAVHEVLVCDNNSTDRTRAIVEEYAAHLPIRVIDVPVQGTVHARNAGFDAATGEIIARIDADALIEPGWFDAVASFFEAADEDVAAVTGAMIHFDMPRFRFDPFVRYYVDDPAERKRCEPVQFATIVGSNMAIRRKAWMSVRGAVNTAPGIWEDVDLAWALVESGYRTMLSPAMAAQVSGRRLLDPPRAYYRYTRSVVTTVRERGRADLQLAARVHVVLSMVNYFVRYFPARTWDPVERRYDWRLLRLEREARPIP
ncbi:glycosyltransferase family A protein [Prescottella sp. R16]|uniref:glycosyltransferase family 2 protein n=1 Tax=Prescottella sp. R16 TaxID=3064529 RepID=UPI00272ED7E6|nr:glycosyltransferase family A protein [Prescottella sp. R16]